MSLNIPKKIRRPAPNCEQELWLRAQALSGYTVGELAQALQFTLPSQAIRSKGSIGQLVEHALGSDTDAGQRPDFVSLGIELKTIPVNKDRKPTESTFCCAIDMDQCDRAEWESSRLKQRIARVLWIPLEDRTMGPLPERKFLPPVMWSPNNFTLLQLRADWTELMGAIGAGLAVDGYQGEILQVRPKAAHSGVRSVAPGVDGATHRLPLGFYLRPKATQGFIECAPHSP